MWTESGRAGAAFVLQQSELKVKQKRKKRWQTKGGKVKQIKAARRSKIFMSKTMKNGNNPV